MSMIPNSTSLTTVVNANARLVDVDTSSPNVVMFFRSADDQTEYRVEMFPDEYHDRYDLGNNFQRVEWLVQEFPVTSHAQ